MVSRLDKIVVSDEVDQMRLTKKGLDVDNIICCPTEVNVPFSICAVKNLTTTSIRC